MPNLLHRYANPTRFLRLAAVLLPWFAGATMLLLAAGLWFALVASPADYQQGDTVRIMYIHVPSAWLGLFAYGVLAVASAVALIWRHPLAELTARAAAPIGAGFTFLCLVTGSLWGEPMWGTWWAWDARLTSMLVMFFIYLGYMALANAFDDPERGGRAASILGVAGAINLPIVHFSVTWWNTLHQGSSVFRKGGPTMPPVYLEPLLILSLAYMAAFGALWLVRIRGEVWRKRANALALRAAG